MVIALILAGGTGTRLGGDIPKQYIEVNGKPIISYCLQTIMECNEIDGMWIVASKEWQYDIKKLVDRYDEKNKFKGFSEPGSSRQMSIYNGLRDMSELCDETDYILIHDAARPLLKERQIVELCKVVQHHDGVLPVLPMKDTIYYSDNGINVSKLLKRSCLYAGQAPEIFVYGKYLRANELLKEKAQDINGSTEPAIMAGMDIVMVQGDENNFKVTTLQDLRRFEQMMREEDSL